MQMLRSGSGQVPEGCGAYIQVRFRKVPVQRLGEVPAGSGADPRRQGSGRFRCRYLVRSCKVPLQMLNSASFRCRG